MAVLASRRSRAVSGRSRPTDRQLALMAEPRHVRGVLDTSTIILLRRLSDSALLPAEPLITAVTLAELSVGPLVAATVEERAARQAVLQEAEADFIPLPFDAV